MTNRQEYLDKDVGQPKAPNRLAPRVPVPEEAEEEEGETLSAIPIIPGNEEVRVAAGGNRNRTRLLRPIDSVEGEDSSANDDNGATDYVSPGAFHMEGRNGPRDDVGTVQYSMGAPDESVNTGASQQVRMTSRRDDDNEENLAVAAVVAPTIVDGTAVVVNKDDEDQSAGGSDASDSPTTKINTKVIILLLSIIAVGIFAVVVVVIMVMARDGDDNTATVAPQLSNSITETSSTGSPTSSPIIMPPLVPTIPPSPSSFSEPTTLTTKSPTSPPTKNPTKQPTRRPTPSPTKQPTKQPTRRPTPFPTSMEQVVISMLSTFIPDVPSTTIQQQAIDWLVENNNDGGYVATRQSYFLLERFVLAIMFYTMDGVDWIDDGDDNNINFSDTWLTGRSVCDWSYVECRGGDGKVDFVNLCK